MRARGLCAGELLELDDDQVAAGDGVYSNLLTG
jgi:hypothetical protein